MAYWSNKQTNNIGWWGGWGSGDVVWPASSTDNAIARFDSTTGKLLQNSTVTLWDAGDISNANAIFFDTTPTAITPTEGALSWNSTDWTLDLGMNGWDITMQLGQEMFIKVRNQSGATITNGKVVYFSGRLWNRPLISLARSDVDATSRVAWVLTEDIASPADWFITTVWYVRQIKTDYTGSGIWGTTWVEWDLLYVSKTDAGVITNVEPSVPHHSDIIGTVGIVWWVGIWSILINLERHKTLEWLSDINGTPLTTTGQFPVWNQSSGYFDFTSNINDYTKIGWSFTADFWNNSSWTYYLTKTVTDANVTPTSKPIITLYNAGSRDADEIEMVDLRCSISSVWTWTFDVYVTDWAMQAEWSYNFNYSLI